MRPRTWTLLIAGLLALGVFQFSASNAAAQALDANYRWHNGEWWYAMPGGNWVYWRNNQWNPYDPNAFVAPQPMAPGYAYNTWSSPYYGSYYSEYPYSSGYSTYYGGYPGYGYGYPGYGYGGYGWGGYGGNPNAWQGANVGSSIGGAIGGWQGAGAGADIGAAIGNAIR